MFLLKCMTFLQVKESINGEVGVLNLKKQKKSNIFTENWIPVRAIQNNMIVTYDNFKVAGVKISPRNIFILDVDSQNRILIALKNFYNMIDFEFWLVVADRPVDISVYMSQLQLLYKKVYSTRYG